MGVDLAVDFDCATKRAVGGGDALRGTEALIGMIKARGRAEVVMGHNPGKRPEEVSFTVVVHGPDGMREQHVTAADMLAQAAPLAATAAACAGCPARRLDLPHGCIGSVGYPISERAEQWLVDRIQRADQLGGKLMLDAIRDFGYGDGVSEWRDRGLLEAQPGLVRDIGGPVPVGGDALFHALLAVGGSLDPFHCALVLLWVGGMQIDGEVPDAIDAAPLQALTAMTTAAERARRTGFVIPPVAERDVAEVRGMLQFLYTAFVAGVPLLVDA